MGLYTVVKAKVKHLETRKKFKQIVHLLIKKSKTIYKNNNKLFLAGGKFASWKVKSSKRIMMTVTLMFIVFTFCILMYRNVL